MRNRLATNCFPSNIDLVQTAQAEYDFLRLVDQYPMLYYESLLKNAVHRYEKYWLPLVAKYNQVLVAPLDIEWVWHCHILSPVAYQRDCLRLVGKVIDHKPMYLNLHTQTVSKKYWSAEYPDTKYDIDLTDLNPTLISQEEFKCSYDIVAAAQRHRTFIYNTSFQHFRDKKFLKSSLKRYLIMLSIKRKSPETFVVPCYDMDLIWHGHQQHVLHYYEDTKHVLGKVLNHDDSTTDRSLGSELQIGSSATKLLWEKFHSKYEVMGGMLRGEPPLPKVEMDKYSFAQSVVKNWTALLHLLSISISDVPLSDSGELRDNEYIVDIEVTNDGSLPMFRRRYHVINGIREFKLEDETFFQYDSNMEYKIKVACADSTLEKQFIGKFSIPSFSFAQRQRIKTRLKTRSATNETITCMLILHTASYSAKHDTVFRANECGSINSSKHLKLVIGSLQTMLPIALTMDSAPCEYTDNPLKHLGHFSSSLKWRVVHSQYPALSALEVHDSDGNVIATSHTIDNSTVPKHKQVSEPSNVFTCDSFFERVMLIRGQRGDWGLVKSSWEGYNNVYGGRLGNLKVQLFTFEDKETRLVKGIDESLSSTITKLSWLTEKGGGSVDLVSGEIRLSKLERDVPEHLCVGLSIAVLFVLSQPRPPPDINGYHSPDIRMRNKLKLKNMLMLHAAGLHFTLLPRWYHKIKKKGHFCQVHPKHLHDFKNNIGKQFRVKFSDEWVMPNFACSATIRGCGGCGASDGCEGGGVRHGCGGGCGGCGGGCGG